MTDLILYQQEKPVGLINPISGEIAPFDDPCAIAAWVDAANALSDQMRDAREAAALVLNAELDRKLAASCDLGGYKVKGETYQAAFGAVAIDVDALRSGLAALVREGVIDREAARACFRRKVTVEVADAGVKRLKTHPAGAALLASVSTPAPRPRKKPTVERVRPALKEAS